MAKKSSGSAKTGKRPTGNTMGMQGAKLAPANPKGQSNVTQAAGIMSSGKGPGKTKGC